jgi:hypothetical protein
MTIIVRLRSRMSAGVLKSFGSRLELKFPELTNPVVVSIGEQDIQRTAIAPIRPKTAYAEPSRLN